MNKYTILDAKWWTPPNPFPIIYHVQTKETVRFGDGAPVIGIVAIQSHKNQWKCYIGYSWGNDEPNDAQFIAHKGASFGSKEAACALFPQLDPEEFRY